MKPKICNDSEKYIFQILDLKIMYGVPIKRAKELANLLMVYEQY
jgi:hypothetical protein